MGVKHMSGTPWHTEVIKKDIDEKKRHKKRCRHYIIHNGHCNTRFGNCIGSTQCPYYEEIESLNDKEEKKVIEKKEKKIIEKKESKTYTEKEGEKYYPIGCGVKHIKYGKGLVLEITNGKIVVEFLDCGIIKFSLNDTINKKLLKRI